MSEEFSMEGIRVYQLEKMDFLELVEHINKLPAILPERTIWCLEAFLNGWLIHSTDNGTMSKFTKYVFHLYSFENTNIGWARLINLNTQDSFDALDKFFELFNEFRKLDEGRP